MDVTNTTKQTITGFQKICFFPTLFFPFLEAAMFLINKSKVKYIWQSIIDRSIVRYWFKDRFMASSLVTREILFPIFDFTGRGRLF